MGDHEATRQLKVYLHWSPNTVYIEPVIDDVDSFRSEYLEWAFPTTKVMQRIARCCPMIEFFSVTFLPINGGYNAEEN